MFRNPSVTGSSSLSHIRMETVCHVVIFCFIRGREEKNCCHYYHYRYYLGQTHSYMPDVGTVLRVEAAGMNSQAAGPGIDAEKMT